MTLYDDIRRYMEECPTWYAPTGTPLAPVDALASFVDWVDRPEEASPETNRHIIKVLRGLYDNGRLPLSSAAAVKELHAVLAKAGK